MTLEEMMNYADAQAFLAEMAELRSAISRREAVCDTRWNAEDKSG